jgi:hypothetical protein
VIFNPKLFEPMPEDIWRRTPPRLRIMYMVKRVLNQAKQRAAFEASLLAQLKEANTGVALGPSQMTPKL